MGNTVAGRSERRRSRHPADVQPFDPRQPARLSPDNRRALAVVHESFANRFTMLLATRLRTVARVAVSSTEQVSYADFMAETPDPSCLAVLSMLPMPGTGVLRLDLPLAMAIIDRLLGGTGEGPHPERALSAIESNLLKGVLDATAADLGTAYAPLMQMTPEVVRHESKPQLVRGAAPASTMIKIDFEVLLGEDVSGATLIMPLATLGPALDSFVGTGSPLSGSTETAALVAAGLMNVPIDVTVQFPPVALTSREIIGLQPGDIVPLRHAANSPLTVSAAGVACRTGVPGRRGNRLACLIVDPEEENPTWPS